MPETVFVPFPKPLYDDLIRFSDGRCDPAALAASQVEAWISLNFTMSAHTDRWNDEHFADLFDERAREFAEKYAAWVIAEWDQRDREKSAARLAGRKPLVWKQITVPAGSEVRMSYGGTTHYATIRDGKIEDADGRYSPSEWASKVAEGTSRNAWRDLWFKVPGARDWVPAQLVRERTRDAYRAQFMNREDVSAEESMA